MSASPRWVLQKETRTAQVRAEPIANTTRVLRSWDCELIIAAIPFSPVSNHNGCHRLAVHWTSRTTFCRQYIYILAYRSSQNIISFPFYSLLLSTLGLVIILLLLKYNTAWFLAAAVIRTSDRKTIFSVWNAESVRQTEGGCIRST